MKQTEIQPLDISDVINVSNFRLPDFDEGTLIRFRVRVFAGKPEVQVLFSDQEGFGLGFSMTQREIVVCREYAMLTSRINSKIDYVLHDLRITEQERPHVTR